MKTLTSAAETAIEKKYGVELITVVEIFWNVDSPTYYADKDVDGILGKILQHSPLESILTSDNVQTYTANVTLDDTDGSIKAIIESTDVHKKSANIYQFVNGTDFTLDKILVYSGEITTPFTWGEGERSITFNISSEIESFEIGFSPEESQLSLWSVSLGLWLLATLSMFRRQK